MNMHAPTALQVAFAAPGAKPKLVFAHIPKTGGTALSDLVSRHCEPGWMVTEFPGCRSDALGNYIQSDVECFIRRMPPEQFAQCRIFSAHLAIGFDATLNAPFRYVSMLREPVDRMISGFLYGTPGSENLPLEQLLFGLHRSVSIGASVGFDNPLTRTLSGSQVLCPMSADTPAWELPPVSQDDRALAIRRLRTQFEFVGLHERFADSCNMILSILGMQTEARARRLNETRARLRRDCVPQATLRAMHRHLRHDQAVYAAGCEIFNRHAVEHHLDEVSAPAPVPSHGPFSSGGHAHVTPCDDAFGTDPCGVWVSHPLTPRREFIGCDSPAGHACRSLEVQVVDGLGVMGVEFAVEASDDDFCRDVREFAQVNVSADGAAHRFQLNAAGAAARSWRLRTLATWGSGPLAIARVSFEPCDAPRAERDIESIRAKVERAIAEFSEERYASLLAEASVTGAAPQAAH